MLMEDEFSFCSSRLVANVASVVLAAATIGGAAVDAASHAVHPSAGTNDDPGDPGCAQNTASTSLVLPDAMPFSSSPTHTSKLFSGAPPVTQHFGRHHFFITSPWWTDQHETVAADLSAVLSSPGTAHITYYKRGIGTQSKIEMEKQPASTALDTFKAYLAEGLRTTDDDLAPTSAVLRRVDLHNNTVGKIALDLQNYLNKQFP